MTHIEEMATKRAIFLEQAERIMGGAFSPMMRDLITTAYNSGWLCAAGQILPIAEQAVKAGGCDGK